MGISEGNMGQIWWIYVGDRVNMRKYGENFEDI
jgi:hypothetical protein